MIDTSSGYKTKLESQSNQPRIRFAFNGSNYDAYVESVPSLRRDTKLSSGTAIVKVTNINQTWNIFESDLTNLGKTAELKLYFYDFFIGSSRVVAVLDGDSQYFYRTDADFPESGIRGNFTIQAFIRTGSLQRFPIANKFGGAGNRMYTFYAIAYQLALRISGDGTEVPGRTTTDANMILDTWYHVAVAWDSSAKVAKFYRDGSLLTEGGDTMGSTYDGNPDFSIGKYETYYGEGGIYNVALFDDVRTPEEIAASAVDPDEDLSGAGNIIGQWLFDEAAVATFIDNKQADPGRDLIPYDGGNETFGNCGRTELPECIPYFTGTVEKVRYEDAFAFLYIRDKMAPMLEIPLQSGQYPVEIYDPIGEEVCFNPADLVWKILVDFGGLDATVGVGNVDIDYDSWVAWHNDCVAGAKNYCIRGRFTGHSIRTALLAIANRSNSYIWVDNTSKFRFAPPYDAAGQTFSITDCEQIDLDISKEGIINDCIVYYGYQPNVGPGTWTGTQSDDDAGSKAAYGDREFTEESRVVWHWNVSSALSDAVYKILGYKNPIKYIRLVATMKGFITEIADIVTITESLKGLSAESVRIIEVVSLNLTEGTVMLNGIMTT